MSSIALWIVSAGAAAAHEVLPTIADLFERDGGVSIEMRLNAEALIAGIDLDSLEDTDAASNADRYDELRALPPEELAARFRDFWPQMAEAMALEAGGTSLTPALDSVEVVAEPDLEQLRDTAITFSAPLPEGANGVSLTWPDGYGLLILRQQGPEAPYTGTLDGGDRTPEIALVGGGADSGWSVFVRYIAVGFDHILPQGPDHVLFVLGLFFLAQRWHPLLWQVTAFTLAHTITLGLAASGYVNVSPGIVEPLIAASIVYVAVENVIARDLHPWRPVIIFGFGLLHGLGFASVLGEFGLPEGAFLPALVGFNIGVEVGQLVVIAAAFAISFAALRASRIAGMEGGVVAGYIAAGLVAVGLIYAPAALIPDALRLWVGEFALPIAVLSFLCAICTAASSVGLEAYRRFVAIPASLAIATVGAVWFVERTFL